MFVYLFFGNTFLVIKNVQVFLCLRVLATLVADTQKTVLGGKDL